MRTPFLASFLRRLGIALGLAAGLIALGANPGCSCAHSTGAGIDAGDTVVPGSIGRYSDLAVGNGHVWVSAYEDLYGDLLVADVTQLPDPIPLKQWTIVDGVNPAAPVVMSPTGYRGGIIDPGPDEGRWSSIAVDANGNPYVAYEEYAMDAAVNPHDRGALRVAYSTDQGKTWTTMTVDPGNGNPGQTMYTSIAFDPTGIPQIAYFQSEQPDGSGGFQGQLKLARASTPTPAMTSDWTIQTVDHDTQTCGGLCPKGMACLQSTQACVTLDTTPCSPACAAGTGCYLASCVPVVGADPAPEWPQGAGLFAQLGYLPNGHSIIVYYNRTHPALWLAEEPGTAGGWGLNQLAPIGSTADQGQFPSIFVDPSGTVDIAYEDASTRALLFLSWQSGGTVTGPTVVDPGTRAGDRPHPVGNGSAIVADATGSLRILYQDDATTNLLQAKEGSSPTTWTAAEPVAAGTGMAGYGFYTAAKLFGSQIVYSQYVYNRADKVIGQLHVFALP